MWDWFKNSKRLPCLTCGKRHGKSGILVGDQVPHQVVFPGHEYTIHTHYGDARPEVWRLGFIRETKNPRDGRQLVFTAAREWQDDETVTVIIQADDVKTAREVAIDKAARHAGRNAIRGVD
jgi:hypothetical protein